MLEFVKTVSLEGCAMLVKNRMLYILRVLLSLFSAFFLAEYLNCSARTAAASILFALLLLSQKRMNEDSCMYPFAHQCLVWGYAIALTISLILGKHLHVEEAYGGLLTENYITAYSVTDLFAAVFIAPGIRVLLLALFSLLRRENRELRYDSSPIKGERKFFFAVYAFLLAAWLPYLLFYAPGFIFPDSVNSIQQALGLGPLDNRNPILFTLFVRLCLFLGGAFASKDITAGCFIFSAAQMLYVGGCFSYMICWVIRRSGLSRLWAVILTVVYGLTPYIAADSIAMWKDPVFSASVVIYSLLLADFALSTGAVANNKRWLAQYVLCLLVVLFWRNNGVCAVIGVLVFLLALALKNRKREKDAGVVYKARSSYVLTILAITSAAVILWGAVLWPVYKLAGIGTPKEESAGLLLNQMARVAAYEGNMSQEEREYLGTIVPIELYPALYRPCCTDMFKWDEHFRYSALSGSSFLKNWASLLIKNPRLYFEAWELETYGFWSVNRAEINHMALNISNGNPQNVISGGVLEIGEYTLRFHRYLSGSIWEKLLLMDEWSLPLGILNWFVLLTAVFLTIMRRGRMVAALAPSLGLAFGIIMGTPIYYLARYETAVQFLLPMFLLFLIGQRDKKEKAS